jgi:hypothetical protein
LHLQVWHEPTTAKAKAAWDNNLVLGLGGIALFPQEKYKDNLNKFPFRKNVDNLQLTSIGSYQIDKSGKWFASGLLDFRSQLLAGHGEYAHADTVLKSDGSIEEINTNPNRINKRTTVSQFAAPAYLTSFGWCHLQACYLGTDSTFLL